MKPTCIIGGLCLVCAAGCDQSGGDAVAHAGADTSARLRVLEFCMRNAVLDGELLVPHNLITPTLVHPTETVMASVISNYHFELSFSDNGKDIVDNWDRPIYYQLYVVGRPESARSPGSAELEFVAWSRGPDGKDDLGLNDDIALTNRFLGLRFKYVDEGEQAVLTHMPPQDIK